MSNEYTVGEPMSTALKKAKSIFASREPIELAKSLLAPKESVEPVNAMFATEEPVTEPEQVVLENQTVETVHESKLMVCLKILCTLVSKGPMREKQLKHEFKMDETRLKSLIRLLWNRGLIEEEKTRSGTEPRYVVTERGTKVLRVIGPIIKEAHKIRIRDFEALTTALTGAGYS